MKQNFPVMLTSLTKQNILMLSYQKQSIISFIPKHQLGIRTKSVKYFNDKRYYYVLGEDYDIKILGVYNSNDKKGTEYKNVDRKRRNISSRYEVSENTNGNDRSHNGFVSNGRTATNNVELNKEKIQRERNGNRTGIIENDDNDNLSEEKYSKDVEYSEYLELKRENKHTNEVQSIDVLYAVNAKKEVAALDEPEFRPINGTALTTSTISIFNLLDYVNNCFPDILPEEQKKDMLNYHAK